MNSKTNGFILVLILLQTSFICSNLFADDETRPAGEVDSELMRLNETYMEDRARLEEIDPKGEEGELRKKRMVETEKAIAERIIKEVEKYGTSWVDKYRDDKGVLPGGKLEDNKSRLIKLKDKQTTQQEKVTTLEENFERLKKETGGPGETAEQRLLMDQRKYREKFIDKHGSPFEWDEETRQKYSDDINDLTETSGTRWERDKEARSEKLRELGRTIKELAKEKAELNFLEKAVNKTKKRVEQKEKRSEETAQVSGEGSDDFSVDIEEEEIELEEELEEMEVPQEYLHFVDSSSGYRRSYSPNEQMYLKFYASLLRVGRSASVHFDYFSVRVTNQRTGASQEVAVISPTGQDHGMFLSQGFSPSLVGAKVGDTIVARCRDNTISVTIVDDRAEETPAGETAEEPAAEPQLILSPAIVTPGERITVTYRNVPGNASDWISLTSAQWPADQHGEYYYLEGRTEGTLTFTAPEAGALEARLFANWPFGGYEVIGTSNTVQAVLPSGKDLVLRPTRVETGKPVILSFSWVDGTEKDWVTLVRVEARQKEYGQYYHLGEMNTGTFRFNAPEPGQYEVRLLSDHENEIIGRSNPITVIAKEQERQTEPEKFTLRVTTKTANNELADMDAGMRVFITINGEGRYGCELDDPEDDFEPGAVDVFDCEFTYPLSDVKYIILDADGDDEWLCESISFQFIQRGKVSRSRRFNVNTWFSTEQDDIVKLGAVKSKRFDIGEPVR
jgi:PLAT/LH2 domain